MADEMVCRVSVSSGLKVPIDPSNTFAGSAESHVSYSMEFDRHGLTDVQATEKMVALTKELDTGVKLAVAASLDVGYVEGAGGWYRLTPVTVPTIPHTAAAAPTAAKPAFTQPRQGGGGGRQYGQAKVDQSTLPILMIDYFQNGQPIAFVDRRKPKEQGVYSPRAADFQSVDRFTNEKGEKNNIPLWLTDKDGNAKTWEQHLVADAEAKATVGGKAPY